jgi:hypothetical protein
VVDELAGKVQEANALYNDVKNGNVVKITEDNIDGIFNDSGLKAGFYNDLIGTALNSGQITD